MYPYKKHEPPDYIVQAHRFFLVSSCSACNYTPLVACRDLHGARPARTRFCGREGHLQQYLLYQTTNLGSHNISKVIFYSNRHQLHVAITTAGFFHHSNQAENELTRNTLGKSIQSIPNSTPLSNTDPLCGQSSAHRMATPRAAGPCSRSMSQLSPFRCPHRSEPRRSKRETVQRRGSVKRFSREGTDFYPLIHYYPLGHSYGRGDSKPSPWVANTHLLRSGLCLRKRCSV